MRAIVQLENDRTIKEEEEEENPTSTKSVGIAIHAPLRQLDTIEKNKKDQG